MDHKECLIILRSRLEARGFECHPFKVGWYNSNVQPSFRLPYDDDTLAVSLISTPAMFDKTMIPFIVRSECVGKRDPVDECVTHEIQQALKELPGVEVDVLHDYEVDHLRRPRVLVQTAGHVSGAARYYQRQDVRDQPWPPNKKVFGVSIHPKFGGWFAFRSVLVCGGVLAPDLPEISPPDPVASDSDRAQLLTFFNDHWRDSRFRDVVPVTDKYSELQRRYFDTAPKDRGRVIREIQEQFRVNEQTEDRQSDLAS